MKTVSNYSLHIAMLGQKRIPSREGGVEIVVEELAARMAQQGLYITCYNRKGHHIGGKEFDSAKQSSYKGIRLKTVPTVNKKGFAAMTASFFAAVHAAFGSGAEADFWSEGTLRDVVAS